MYLYIKSICYSKFLYHLCIVGFDNMSNQDAERDEIKDETHELQDDESDIEEEEEEEEEEDIDFEDEDEDVDESEAEISDPQPDNG
jgi:hypothetical protein